MLVAKLSNLINNLNIHNADLDYLNDINAKLISCPFLEKEIKVIEDYINDLITLIQDDNPSNKKINNISSLIKNNYKQYLKQYEARISANRQYVTSSYQSAEFKNKEAFVRGDLRAGKEYIYKNQKIDALSVVTYFYEDSNLRVVSIVKRTKVGMDGLMIEIAKNISTHIDDNFLILRDNIFFITGMSNKSWEDDMKDKIPECFRDRVYHHGKIDKLIKYKELDNINNALIIIDEIDTGDKIEQQLHTLLKNSKILDIDLMIQKNIRFIFVSATMINELKDLHHWGDHHKNYKMSIPDEYIGHNDFLEMKIIQEFYPINDKQSAEKWINEDIHNKYGDDYRVHIIRTDNKYKNLIENACKKLGVDFHNHTSDERIERKELENIFNNITNHVVIAVKGFYRRANLIPNDWKKKIGTTMEKHVKKVDPNVQVQGLPGRMTGYWKKDILDGHQTGPHRTSIKAIESYEKFYKNPNESNTKLSKSKKLLTHPQNAGIKITESIKEPIIKKFKQENEAREFCKLNCDGYNPERKIPNNKGFYEATIRSNKKIYSCDEIDKDKMWGLNNDNYRFYPCYRDVNNKDTLEWWIIYYDKKQNKINEDVPNIQNKSIKKNSKIII